MNKTTKETIIKNIRKFKPLNFLMLTVAGIINSIGVIMFLNPVKLYDSGISGTSMLLAQVTPEFFTLSIFLLILNIPLFLYGLKKQGVHFTVYAIYTVAIYSLSAWLITDVLPVDVNFASPLAGEDLLLCALFGGAISGIGSGIEVMAVVFAKKLGVTVGSFVMVYNVILYIICGIVLKSWILPLYSIVAYGAALKTVDFIVEGFDRAKCAMIVTTKPDDVCYILSEVFETGSTKIEVRGGYSNREKTMVYFIVNRFQVAKLKEIVHELDPGAYITISEVADVFTSEHQDKKE